MTDTTIPSDNHVVFDYRASVQALHVPLAEVVKLEKQAKHEFPHDEMLMELHLLRAIKAYANQTTRS
jgi:hypothetical protein